MTGFLARLAERARNGERPAVVRPDLPPAYAPGLLARAPEADFEGIGIAETPPGADPARQDAPGGGARPTGPGRDPGFPRDAAEIPPPPPAAGPGRSPDRAEPAGSHGTGAPEPEAWPPSAARAGRGPGRPGAAAAPARHLQRPQRPPEPSDAADAVPGRPHDPAAARANPEDFAAVRPDQLAVARISPEPGASRRPTAMPGTGTGGPAPHAAGPPRPGPREPDVHISIGRIEVRLQEAAPAPGGTPGRAQRGPRADPAMPLEEYLRRRSGTSR